MACWIIAALLLLGVIVGAELLRRRDLSSHIAPERQEEEDLWNRVKWLLTAFALSLIPFAAGVVWIGFFFSLLMGCIGVAAVVFALFVLWRLL
jgi:dolichyl-phosphate-mannose--protein O-mannosyl transferase